MFDFMTLFFVMHEQIVVYEMRAQLNIKIWLKYEYEDQLKFVYNSYIFTVIN